MTKLSEKDVEFVKRKRKSSKKWRYFFDRTCLIGNAILIAGRLIFKVGYIFLFLVSIVYALSGHSIPKDVAMVLNKITPVTER